ncbi:hypothetical protein Tco_0959337 [Tanacetum coccineum]
MGKTEIKDGDAYKEDLLGYKEGDGKAPYSAVVNGLLSFFLGEDMSRWGKVSVQPNQSQTQSQMYLICHAENARGIAMRQQKEVNINLRKQIRLILGDCLEDLGYEVPLALEKDSQEAVYIIHECKVNVF